MRHAIEDLKLRRLDVVHAGDETFPMTENIRAIALKNLLFDIPKLRWQV
jgi:hypothetical protein